MRGNIEPRGRGFRITVRLGKDDEGKPIRIREQVNGSSDDAEKRLTQILSDHDKGVLVTPDKSPLKDYLNKWLIENVKPNLSLRTYESYYYLCNKHINPDKIGNIPLVGLKAHHLETFYAKKRESGLSKRTVQLLHVCIHKALKHAAKFGDVKVNVAEIVERPKAPRPEFKIMTEKDMQIFLEFARDTEYYALFFAALFTGMRRSELLALRWSECNLELMNISVKRTIQYVHKANEKKVETITYKEPKTKSSRRSIPLSVATCNVLREHYAAMNKLRKDLGKKALDKDGKVFISPDDLVFCHYDGTPYIPDSVTHAWERLVNLCGMQGIRLHDARHSMASYMLAQGIHPKIVQERLGHSSIQITLDIYSHVVPGLQEAAAQAMDNIFQSGKAPEDVTNNNPTK